MLRGGYWCAIIVTSVALIVNGSACAYDEMISRAQNANNRNCLQSSSHRRRRRRRDISFRLVSAPSSYIPQCVRPPGGTTREQQSPIPNTCAIYRLPLSARAPAAPTPSLAQLHTATSLRRPAAWWMIALSGGAVVFCMHRTAHTRIQKRGKRPTIPCERAKLSLSARRVKMYLRLNIKMPCLRKKMVWELSGYRLL